MNPHIELETAVKDANHAQEEIINRRAVASQDDLFDHKTEEQKLQEWCAKKGFFSTADIMQYALNSYYLRAKRTVNDFVREGKVRIISKDECIFRNLRGKMNWYEWVGQQEFARLG